MNKKLMAAAVAGAFVAPALVHAQTATVQVYGRANVEYSYVDPGRGKPNTDMFQTPGGSSVGFKGQEQLGGGLTAWFQCESSADVRGLNQDGFCTRNSAIGMRGGWGNLYFGKWDTPFKRAAATGTVGSGETGSFGSAFLFLGNSTGGGATGGQGASQSLSRNVWKRREAALLSYESPSFSGFKVGLAYSAANATGVTDATTNARPRVGSIAGSYSSGALNVGLGYEKHWEFGSGNTGIGAVAAAAGNASFPGQFVAGGANPITSFTAPTAAAAATAGSGFDDRAWTIGASYNFMGNLLVGVQYIDMKYELAAGSEAKKRNWHLGADWNFAGPHHIMGSWVNAGDTKGNATAAQFAAAGLTSGNGALVAPGGGTGGDFYVISYQYDFSKRTLFRLSYSHLDNDNAARYSLGGMPTTSAANAGTNQSAFGFFGQHSW
jgi:predicted porin